MLSISRRKSVQLVLFGSGTLSNDENDETCVIRLSFGDWIS